MDVIFRLLGAGLSVGAGFVGTKLVDALWEKLTGNAPPRKDGIEDSIRTTLVFALISGAVNTLIQVLTSRGTQRAIERFAKSRGLT